MSWRGKLNGNNDYSQSSDPFEDSRELVPQKRLPIATATPSIQDDSGSIFGSPMKRRLLSWTDVLTLLFSLVLMAIAIVTVASNNFAWRLGYTNQLVVIGFCLNLMTACLSKFALSLFISLEAVYGASTLQNYDGLFRMSFWRPQLALYWRVCLLVLICMPLGLSASYKTFTGGQSYVPMKRSVDMPSSYGIFPPPGLTPLGSNQGTFIFANATIPFAQKAQHLAPDIRPTNLTYVLGKNVSDPPLPPFPQVYGFNMVLLSNQSTVFLDTPSDEYLKSIQASLAIDESVAISADVNGLVSAYNETVNAHPESLDQKLASFCATAHNQLIGVVDLYNRWTLMALEDMVNDTSVWLGFVPSDKAQTTCDGLGKFVNQYDNRRVKCQGTWQITRQSVFLTDGSCSDEALPDRMQAILKINLGISRWFMGPLTDLLADFSLARNESVWKAPSLATAVAGALWSRIAAGFSPAARSPWSLEPIMYGWNISDTEFVPWPETGAWYEVNDTAISIRPAMRRAASLYGVIVLQPLLSITFLILRCLCCSAPVSEGFGLISILAGVDHASLNALRGASYSGKLNRTTHVHIALEDGDDGRGKVRYHLSGDNVTKRNGKLHPGRLYE